MYLNQRSIEMLKTLLLNNDKRLVIDELARDYGISERSVRYDLESIDYFLKVHHLPKLKRNVRVEIDLDHSSISTSDKETILKKLICSEHYYTPEERQDMIYMELFLENQRLTVEYLMDVLNVSRSTINNDIKNLKSALKKINVFISYSNKEGYFLKGNEQNIRRKAINIINNNASLMELVESKLSKETMRYFESLVEEVEASTEKVFTGNSFRTLVNSLMMVLYRLKGSHYIHHQEDNRKCLNNIKEYIILKSKSKELEEKFKTTIPEEEIHFIVNLFLESNLLKANEYLSENWIDLHLLINEFIEDISVKLQVDLTNDQELFDALVLHLGPAFKRLEAGIYLKNEILTYIQEKYSDIYKIVNQSLNTLTKNMNLNFTSDEIGYVTLHVVSALEKMTMNEKHLNVLLVCDSGLGTSRLLESRIKKYFSFKIIGTISVRLLTNEFIKENKVDLIISTTPIHKNYQVPAIQVTPLLTDEEIKTLKDFEIKDSLNSRTKNLEGANIPMLNDLLIKETIATDVSVNNWEEAVREGGKLLLKEGYIEEEYIDAMVNNVKELGPYIVIAPNIAMPHARPEKGVHKIGISLITLKEPIHFGHEENDPVKVVICLAAIDHSSHLKALSDLVNYLNNKEFTDLLKNEKSVDKIINYINEEDKNGLSRADN